MGTGGKRYAHEIQVIPDPFGGIGSHLFSAQHMTRLLHRLAQLLRDHVELYATLPICLLVVGLDVLHIAPQGSVDSAILLVLMLLVVGNLRDRHNLENWSERLHQSAAEPGVKWYAWRGDAEQDMYRDLINFEHIVFLGVSQTSLVGYLTHVLNDPERSGPLPWRCLHVYFASPEIGTQLGTQHQVDNFVHNMKSARSDIAILLTNPRYVKDIPNFQFIEFIQYQQPMSHGGSMYSHYPISETGASAFSVIYVSHSQIRHLADLKEGLTIRLETLPNNQMNRVYEARMRYYTDAYLSLRRGARNLGTFKRSIWDLSAEQWSKYAETSYCLKHSMETLVEMLGFQVGEKVLDLGSGSGETSSPLVDAARAKKGKVVLLDGSPQMTAFSRRRYQGNQEVSIALCGLPTHASELEDIDLADEKFSCIVIHQSLHDLVTSYFTLDDLAEWCYRKLTDTGRVIIGAHNNVVLTTRPKTFENWHDPLRAALRRELRGEGNRLKQRGRASIRFRGDEIEQAFKNKNRFRALPSCQQHIPLSMDERIRMWRVPAIMNSIFEAERMDSNKISKILDGIPKETSGQPTMDRIMTFWTFTKSSSLGQAGPHS
jgi:SAM-dependent methyltransferase